MMSGLKCSAQLWIVASWKMPRWCSSEMMCFALWNARERMAAVRVPDRGVHDVEREDREDLDPPVEVRAVAEAAAALHRAALRVGAHDASPVDASSVSPSGVSLAGRSRRSARRACSRRTSDAVPEQAGGRRRARRRRRGRTRNNTSAPSRTPSPPNEIGITCSIDTAGTNANAAAIGTSTSSARKINAYDADDRELVHERGAEHARAIWRGSRRARSTPWNTAPMKRVQFSLSAKRPARPGWPAAKRISPSDAERRRRDEQREPGVRRRAAATAGARTRRPRAAAARASR